MLTAPLPRFHARAGFGWIGADLSASEEMVLVNYGQNCTPDPARRWLKWTQMDWRGLLSVTFWSQWRGTHPHQQLDI